MTLRAVRRVTRIGTLIPSGEDVLRRVLAYDGRLASSGSWRTFVQDQEIRAAAAELMESVGPGRPAHTA